MQSKFFLTSIGTPVFPFQREPHTLRTHHVKALDTLSEQAKALIWEHEGSIYEEHLLFTRLL